MDLARLHDDLDDLLTRGLGFRVFAYGSLLWRPAFAPAECLPARVHGWHRALRMRSRVNRGTPQCPGLVFALLPGGSCRGELHLEDAGRAHATLDALWEREMPGGGVYQPRWLQALTPRGSRPALAFTLPPRHPSHAGRLDDATLLHILAQARGRYGSTLDYLLRTAERLGQLGIRDAEVSRLVDLAERHGLTDGERRLGRDQPFEILAGVDVDQHTGVARLDRE
ncbi:MAG: hypothetical protein RL654_2616 [Pseudomonadota bacterium]|jgi:cation transport protein ChaC